MTDTTEIIENQIVKINGIIESYLEEYHKLCESEIEKLFLTNLFYYFFKRKFTINQFIDWGDDEFYIFFKDFKPIWCSPSDKNFLKYVGKIKEREEDGSKYKLIGIELIEEGQISKSQIICRTIKKYRFIPQFPINIENSNFRLDIALLFSKTVNDELILEQNIAIECDGYEFHSDKQSLTKDSQRTRKLMTAGWKVLRYSGSEIYQTQGFSEIEKLIREIKSILNASK
ncbi:MAG: DUF559 domain-containing protein [Bacteroidota bacterium]|nr:DUF559 domain-containing protein [Bacteroidota bacterium]